MRPINRSVGSCEEMTCRQESDHRAQQRASPVWAVVLVSVDVLVTSSAVVLENVVVQTSYSLGKWHELERSINSSLYLFIYSQINLSG